MLAPIAPLDEPPLTNGLACMEEVWADPAGGGACDELTAPAPTALLRGTAPRVVAGYCEDAADAEAAVALVRPTFEAPPAENGSAGSYGGGGAAGFDEQPSCSVASFKMTTRDARERSV